MWRDSDSVHWHSAAHSGRGWQSLAKKGGRSTIGSKFGAERLEDRDPSPRQRRAWVRRDDHSAGCPADRAASRRALAAAVPPPRHRRLLGREKPNQIQHRGGRDRKSEPKEAASRCKVSNAVPAAAAGSSRSSESFKPPH